MIRRILIAILMVTAVLISLVFDDPASTEAGAMASGLAQHLALGPAA